MRCGCPTACVDGCVPTWREQRWGDFDTRR
nr:MAG TPA: 4Fe-4S binding domain protein [Caudoviricetes sp.]